jgi:hypothetical protein
VEVGVGAKAGNWEVGTGAIGEVAVGLGKHVVGHTLCGKPKIE